MILPDQIKFVNDLIKENPEITIWQYLEAVQEIDIIKKIQNDMAKMRMKPEQWEKLSSMMPTASYVEIKKETGLATTTIYKHMGKKQIDLKAKKRMLKAERAQREAEQRKKEQEERMKVIKSRQAPNLRPDSPGIQVKAVEVVKQFTRPAAEYSNHSPYGIADTLHQITA